MISSRPSLAAFACSLLAPALAFAGPEVLGSSTVVSNGDPSNRYDVVFVGDGYTADEMESYRAAVSDAVKALQGSSPYREYWAYLNVHRVDVASAQSGFSEKDGRQLDTAFSSSYGHSYRYIKGDQSAINRVVARHAPDADAIVCVVNGGYGGVSYGKICFAGSTSGGETVVHELGHTIGRLADEYAGFGELALPAWLLSGVETIARPLARMVGWRFDNATTKTSRGSIPWKHWIEASTPIPTTGWSKQVGLFEGAFYFESKFYRPQAECMMRDSGDHCAVCREVLVLALSEKVMPYRWTSLERKGGLQLGFETLVPGPLKARWFDGTREEASARSQFFASYEELGRGNHRIRVEVQDATPFVRRDANQVLVHSHDWHLKGKNGRLSVRKERTNRHRGFFLFRWFSSERRLAGDWDERGGLEGLMMPAIEGRGLEGEAPGIVAHLR